MAELGEHEDNLDQERLAILRERDVNTEMVRGIFVWARPLASNLGLIACYPAMALGMTT